MFNYKVFPIPNSVAARIREVRVATSDINCHCLRPQKVIVGHAGAVSLYSGLGEGRILFSYGPNQHNHPYNEVGPIYIHERACEPYADHEAFPAELKTRRPLVLRCYDDNGILVGGELVGERPVEDVIRDLFEKCNVKYLHARTATVGCYIARIERATSST